MISEVGMFFFKSGWGTTSFSSSSCPHSSFFFHQQLSCKCCITATLSLLQALQPRAFCKSLGFISCTLRVTSPWKAFCPGRANLAGDWVNVICYFLVQPGCNSSRLPRGAGVGWHKPHMTASRWVAMLHVVHHESLEIWSHYNSHKKNKILFFFLLFVFFLGPFLMMVCSSCFQVCPQQKGNKKEADRLWNPYSRTSRWVIGQQPSTLTSTDYYGIQCNFKTNQNTFYWTSAGWMS